MKSCAIIDPRLPENCIVNLRDEDFEIIPVPLTGKVDVQISGHPDIQMFQHEKNLFVHPDIDNFFLKKAEKYVNIIICSTPLGRNYPEDIPYNIACVHKTAIHKKESTDKKILEYMALHNINVINTNQGYTKCSTLIVDEQNIITSDKSIQQAAEKSGINTLLITPGYIDIPGYGYGFIGGASGKFRDTIYLTGSISDHPDRDRIKHFIHSKGLKLKILSNNKIFDAGSIFFIG